MFTALHDIQPLFQLVFLITCCVIVSCLTALFYLQRLYKKSSLYRLAQDYCFKLLTIGYEVKQQQEALRQIWGKIGLNDARAAS